jgi:hypothetical protein
MRTYHHFRQSLVEPGSLVIKLYRSDGNIRSYIRQIARPGSDDVIFPGEEMEPEQAFRVAENHKADGESEPVFVELAEGVDWHPAWGKLI